MKKILAGVILMLIAPFSFSQMKWIKVDSLFGPLPSSIHVYKTTDSIEGKPNIAFYAEVDINDKQINPTVDTTTRRRLTPREFYEKNAHPLLVVNCSFFEFKDSRNLNVVMKNGKLLSYNTQSVFNKKDSNYHYITRSAIGISPNRKMDVAWLYTDSSRRWPYAMNYGPSPRAGNDSTPSLRKVAWAMPCSFGRKKYKWKMETAVGGGPVLLYNGDIRITNNEEKMFAGKAISDKHPRTAMGYTKEGKLIVLVVQGRFAGIAEGATLTQEAIILKDIGCSEAINLDGGGSTCMLINGKETITPSDKTGERPVPAVFLIK